MPLAALPPPPLPTPVHMQFTIRPQLESLQDKGELWAVSCTCCTGLPGCAQAVDSMPAPRYGAVCPADCLLIDWAHFALAAVSRMADACITCRRI